MKEYLPVSSTECRTKSRPPGQVHVLRVLYLVDYVQSIRELVLGVVAILAPGIRKHPFKTFPVLSPAEIEGLCGGVLGTECVDDLIGQEHIDEYGRGLVELHQIVVLPAVLILI